MVYSERDTTSYLEVRGIKINDEAVYKCEITYLDVVESCLVVQFINLTTLSKFRRVRIISIVVNYATSYDVRVSVNIAFAFENFEDAL